MLQSGVGTHSGRSGDTLFPRGMKGVERGGEQGGRESMGASGEGLDGKLGFDEEITSYAMFARSRDSNPKRWKMRGLDLIGLNGKRLLTQS